jgi:Lipase maturation factor
MYDAEGYWLTRWLLQRGLGIIYLCAFLAVVNQFRPLLGERGLLPAPAYLRQLRFRDAPSLFHFFPTDRAFAFCGWLGVLLSLLATLGLSEGFGMAVSMGVWLGLWILYLSFVNIGQTFYAFGWESLLLECGFLAIFLGPADAEPAAVLIWLLRWVLFRIMFGAGMIKIRGDPCWRDLSCLDVHFETQPMPNPLSWYFHWLPRRVHQAGVLFNHLAELIVPFAYFAPQPLAAIAGVLTILFQGTLIVSGNFSWLNHLTLVLAVSTFEDAQLRGLLPLTVPDLSPLSPVGQTLAWGVALLVAARSIQPIRNLCSKNQAMNTSYDPWHLVNSYGAFGSITHPRFEIVLEGSSAALPTPKDWLAYEFKGKPGDPHRRPPLVAPYHLRLDWLMWFAAMPSRGLSYPPWLIHLVGKLLSGDAAGLALLRHNPFPESPPRRIRARYYHYRFTTPAERRASGCWWHRELVGDYLPPLSLDNEQFRAILLRLGWQPE